MPLRRTKLPWMVLGPQARPCGPGFPSALRPSAMVRDDRPSIFAENALDDLGFGLVDVPHADEPHALKKPSDIFLIAAKPVHRLGQHDIEAAAQGVMDQFLNAGPE